MSPRSGPTTGGTTITVSGTRLPLRGYVWIGGEPAPVVAAGPGTITAVTGPHTRAGTYDVEVVGADGTRDRLVDAFTYLAVGSGPAPDPSAPSPTTPTTSPTPSSPPTTAPPVVRQLANGLKVKALASGSPLTGVTAATPCRTSTCRGTLV